MTDRDPTAHPRFLAIREVPVFVVGSERLGIAISYVTLEPCTMCEACDIVGEDRRR